MTFFHDAYSTPNLGIAVGIAPAQFPKSASRYAFAANTATDHRKKLGKRTSSGEFIASTKSPARDWTDRGQQR
jgi:hypothetical protein